MAGRGPPPEPTSLKILKGYKRPRNRNEPKPRPVAPSCPRWLDKEARKEWRRLTPSLERLGLLTALDRAAFAIYCQAWSDWKEAELALTEHGCTHRTPSGQIKLRPEVSIADKSARLMLSFAMEFGMTPASRSRLSVPQTEDTADPPWLD